MKIVKSSWMVLAWVFLATLCACGESGGDNSGGDADWGEQQEWDEDPDLAEYEAPEDGDREWDRVEIDLQAENGLVDDLYPQWEAKQWSRAIPSLNQGTFPTGVTCVLPLPDNEGANKGDAYVGTDHGLYRYDGETGSFEKLDNPAEEPDDFLVQAMDVDTSGNLWLISAIKLYELRNGRFTYHACEEMSPLTLIVRGDTPTIGTSNGLYRWMGSSCVKDSNPTGMIRKLTKASSSLYAALRSQEGVPQVLIWDNTQWTSPVTQENGLLAGRVSGIAMNPEGSLLVFGENGLQELDKHGAIVKTYATEPGGLPETKVNMAAWDADGVLWAASDFGLWRYSEEFQRFQVFSGRRFLHDDTLSVMGFDADGGVLVGNSDGISHLGGIQQTLEPKALELLTVLSERHVFDGFVRPLTLQDTAVFDGAGADFLPDEGFWTGLTTASLSLLAATTTVESERQAASSLAKQTMQALLKLEDIPNGNGLLGRAVAAEGTMQGQVEGWADGFRGDWWTGATHESYLGWFFGLALYHDLLATGAEKQSIAAAIGRTANLIVTGGFQAVDTQGQAVEGARWSDEYVQGTQGLQGNGGVTALELLAMLRVAVHVTGDDTLWNAYVDRAWDHDYALAGTLQKTVSDARLGDHQADLWAFLALYLLLRYEDVPDFRDLFVRAVENARPYGEPERNPLYNAIVALAGVEPSGWEDGLVTLRETPSSLLNWRQDSCWRKDVTVQATEPATVDLVLSPFERPLGRLGETPYRCADEVPDGLPEDHPGALGEDDGVGLLLPYWLARHHGLLRSR